MRKVHWVGAIKDGSGYANATRNYIVSIAKTNKVELSVEGVSFEGVKTIHQEDSLIAPFIRRDPGALVRVIHLTPENYEKFRKPGAYNIGYAAWETNQLPPEWVYLCNKMNEMWVPSTWNVKAFRGSGVTVPVIKIPHAIPIPDISTVPPLSFPGDDFSTYWFYSIFQWISRKNYKALLIAYLTEFTVDEPVVLALKTYRMSTSNQEAEVIKNEINQIKNELCLPMNKFPKILFFRKLMSGTEMKQLHMRGNCFVLPTRGEGFGIPFSEAMSLGKPVVGSDYGGSAEFMNDNNSYLIPCRETPVSGMSWMRHYHGRMTWGDPDIIELKKIMRHIYLNREEAEQKGIKAKETITRDFSYETIGNLICKRLLEVH